jgi:hypothetical protein
MKASLFWEGTAAVLASSLETSIAAAHLSDTWRTDGKNAGRYPSRSATINICAEDVDDSI